MTDPEFKQIKSFLVAGVKPSQITEVTGRSWGVIEYVREAQTFDQYKTLVRNFAQKYAHKSGNGKVVAMSASAVKTPVVYKNQLSALSDIKDMLKQQKDLLVAISRTLHSLEELWEYPADYFKDKMLSKGMGSSTHHL